MGEEAGAALVAHPLLRRVSFTGSPETGRLIGVSAAKNLVPFTAELGGKGPLVVFEDADLDAAAAKRRASTTTAARCASRAPASWSRSPCASRFWSVSMLRSTSTYSEILARTRRRSRP